MIEQSLQNRQLLLLKHSHNRVAGNHRCGCKPAWMRGHTDLRDVVPMYHVTQCHRSLFVMETMNVTRFGMVCSPRCSLAMRFESGSRR